MPKLIDISGTQLANNWTVLDKECDLATALANPADSLIVPLALWQNSKQELQGSGKQLTVWLDSDEQAGTLAADLNDLPMIALNFPKFTDGRSYSTAVNLRQHHAYKGEIRAIGDVLRDQLFYMRRCGFSTFDLSDSVKLEDAQAAMQDFTDNYQSTVEQAIPIFRRRA